ncbi:hypothetical protein C0995_007269, partial [Termitomyces sp. Mi166
LLECEHATQEFIVAANAVFFKAQGLATLAPLHETVFCLLEGLLDDWRLLNLNSIEWQCKAEVHQACVNLWSLNKQASWYAEFGKTVVSWEHAISTIEQIRLMHFKKMVIELEPTAPVVAPRTVVDPAPTPASATLLIQHVPSVPYIVDPSSPPMHLHSELLLQEQEEVCHGKGKAKATEDDKDEEGEATQKLRKELEDFVVPTKFDNKLLMSLLPLPLEYYEGDIELLRGAKILGGRKGDITLMSPATQVLVLEKNGAVAKAFLEQQGKLSHFFVLEGYKGKGKAKALLDDSEHWQTFKLTELVNSDSDKEEEEKRVHIIKKIKREHVKEPTGARKRKEIIELENEEVEIVVSKTPMAEPLHQTSKPVVLVPSMPKPIPKPIVALASPVAGPSTAPIVPSSASKPASATPVSKPAPVTSAGTEESSALIVNQAMEVPATQKTLQDEDSSDEDNNKDSNDNEDGKGDDDNSNNDNATMDIDSGKRPEETQSTAPIKAMATEVKALAPVPDTLLQIVLY